MCRDSCRSCRVPCRASAISALTQRACSSLSAGLAGAFRGSVSSWPTGSSSPTRAVATLHSETPRCRGCVCSLLSSSSWRRAATSWAPSATDRRSSASSASLDTSAAASSLVDRRTSASSPSFASSAVASSLVLSATERRTSASSESLASSTAASPSARSVVDRWSSASWASLDASACSRSLRSVSRRDLACSSSSFSRCDSARISAASPMKRACIVCSDSTWDSSWRSLALSSSWYWKTC
mmetsp:Transcript_42493/g.95958  ORF Transcript_42493/g.95958 Transcript_42493/m.95958 type:complete len:241 (+) Transcript_42493:232-954(+)